MTSIINKKRKHKSFFRQMINFLGIFALILFLSHYYMFDRISYYLQITGEHRIVLLLILNSLALFTLIILPINRKLSRAIAIPLSWIVYVWMGIAFLMFCTLLVTDMVWWLLKLIPQNNLSDPFHPYYLGIIASSITIILVGYALWKGLQSVKVKQQLITLKRLPKTLDGLRIIQITDLHIGNLINGKWLQRIVDKVNTLKPDLIVITGDLVDGSVNELRHHVAPLAQLVAQYGTYFVTGNHEYYSGVTQWCDYITSLGVRVLRNEHVLITSHLTNDSFYLVGVDDWASHHFKGEGPDLAKALSDHDPNKLLILLAHQPAAVREAAAFGVDLQLSGHTHAGQIWPFTYLVYLQQPYIKGLYHHDDTETQIYVSPGTGFWGPPMRLGTSAEITDITLRVFV